MVMVIRPISPPRHAATDYRVATTADDTPRRVAFLFDTANITAEPVTSTRRYYATLRADMPR